MKTADMNWGSGTMQHTFDVLHRLAPLPIPLDVEPVAAASDAGVWYDGRRVRTAFHYTMPYGSVQLQVLIGYALSMAFHTHGRPSSRSDRADIYNAMLGVFFEINKFNSALAEAFKTICMPQAMTFVDNAIRRAQQMDEGKMN